MKSDHWSSDWFSSKRKTCIFWQSFRSSRSQWNSWGIEIFESHELCNRIIPFSSLSSRIAQQLRIFCRSHRNHSHLFCNLDFFSVKFHNKWRWRARSHWLEESVWHFHWVTCLMTTYPLEWRFHFHMRTLSLSLVPWVRDNMPIVKADFR